MPKRIGGSVGDGGVNICTTAFRGKLSDDWFSLVGASNSLFFHGLAVCFHCKCCDLGVFQSFVKAKVSYSLPKKRAGGVCVDGGVRNEVRTE